MQNTTDTTRHYLDQIGQVPLLDAEEERFLAQTIEAGRDAQALIDAGERSPGLRRASREGARAKDRFIRANLRLVVSIAKRYPVPAGMELLDLVQEGNLGLEHAVDKFDWRKGFKFSTYATFWIRQAIGRALDQKGSLIRIPGDRSSQIRAALRATTAGADLDPELDALHRLTSVTSLDRTLGDDGDTEFGDLLAHIDDGPEATVVGQLQDELLTRLLEVLDERPRHAVQLRMGLIDGRHRSFREVGDDLGITAEAARRMVHRALETLRGAADGLELAA